MINLRGEMAKMPESREISIRNIVLTAWFQTTVWSLSSAVGVWPRAGEVRPRWSGLAVNIEDDVGVPILTDGILNTGENMELGVLGYGGWVGDVKSLKVRPAGENPADLRSGEKAG